MKQTNKAEIHQKLDQSYNRAAKLKLFSEDLGKALKQCGLFDQDPSDPMTLGQKAKATGTWLRKAMTIGVVSAGVSAALSSDDIMFYAKAGLVIGGLFAKDNREKRLGILFLQYPFLTAAAPVLGMIAKSIHANAEQQDTRASYVSSQGHTVFRPDATIRTFKLTDVTPSQP